MNSILDTEVIICARKCLLLPYFEELMHKAIKTCDQFDYFVSVDFTNLT